MRDDAMAQLLQHCLTPARRCLVILDENTSALPAGPMPDVRILTNRIDVAIAANKLQWHSEFCDFDFSVLDGFVPQQCLYRLSKEKRVVEHILQSAWSLLQTGGELCLAGYKNEGVKTFAKRLQQAAQCDTHLLRGNAQLHVYRLRKTGTANAVLNDEPYAALHEIGQWRGMQVFSKPGVFAWNRFDEGSMFLLQFIDEFLQQTDVSRQSAMDLGCGNGLLALALHRAGCRRVVATDNNAAAIKACRFNFAHHGVDGDIIAADCGAGIDERFELLVCNPPFHRGFDTGHDLTDRFLQTASQLLSRSGRALFVVNAFIPLERKAAGLFRTIRTVQNNGSFKLVQLQI